MKTRILIPRVFRQFCSCLIIFVCVCVCVCVCVFDNLMSQTMGFQICQGGVYTLHCLIINKLYCVYTMFPAAPAAPFARNVACRGVLVNNTFL